MPRLLLQSLRHQRQLQLVLESFEGCIYQAYLKRDIGEQLIWADPHTPLKARSLTDLRERLQGLDIASLQLRQRSAYDEMVGQPPKGDNTLLIPLSLQQWEPVPARTV